MIFFLLFCDNERIKETTEDINNVEIKTYLIRYDEKKEFGKI